jgi:hypothetical protein
MDWIEAEPWESHAAGDLVISPRHFSYRVSITSQASRYHLNATPAITLSIFATPRRKDSYPRFGTFMQAWTIDFNGNKTSDWTAPVRGAGQCLNRIARVISRQGWASCGALRAKSMLGAEFRFFS